MTTTYTPRTPVSTTYARRDTINSYVVLLEDTVASVKDLDWSDIYVYSTYWDSYWWTQRTKRDSI